MNVPTVVVAQSPAHVVVAPAGPVMTDDKKRAFLGVGITELVLGGLLFVIGGIAIAPNVGGVYYGYGAPGIWSGIWTLVAGSLAVATSKAPNGCTITGGLVVSILTCLAAFSAGCYEASLAVAFNYLHVSGYRGSVGSLRRTGPLAIHSILSFLAFAEFTIAIVHSALCCSAGCCGSNNHQGAVVTNTYSTVTTVPVQTGNPPLYSAQPGQTGPPMEQKLGV